MGQRKVLLRSSSTLRKDSSSCLVLLVSVPSRTPEMGPDKGDITHRNILSQDGSANFSGATLLLKKKCCKHKLPAGINTCQ